MSCTYYDLQREKEEDINFPFGTKKIPYLWQMLC